MILQPQKTINNEVTCTGIGLHSGKEASITLKPAPVDSGIKFKRCDLKKNNIVTSSYENVVETKLGTTLANKSGAKILTIEHLMAAIWGMEIDNLLIEINGEEIPIMDGSSAPFIFLIECAGTKNQDESRKIIEITKKIRIEDEDKFIEVTPSKVFSIDIEIDFNHKQLKKQRIKYNSEENSFKNDIARARTFAFKHELDYLRNLGLIKGGSLDNAIVISENGIENEDGLRYKNEFVKHKTLDFIGDIYLCGYRIIGHFKGYKTGHGINNKFLHHLFENKSSWKIL